MNYKNTKSTPKYQYDFLKIVNEIIRNPFFTNSEKTVYVDLLYCNSFGSAFPSQETLAYRHGFKHTKSIRTILKSLRTKTGLTWKKRGYSMSNIYKICVDPYLYVPKSAHTSQLGVVTPLQTGTHIPPNISIEYKKNNIDAFNKEKKEYCGLNGCKDGMIITKDEEGYDRIDRCSCNPKKPAVEPNKYLFSR